MSLGGACQPHPFVQSLSLYMEGEDKLFCQRHNHRHLPLFGRVRAGNGKQGVSLEGEEKDKTKGRWENTQNMNDVALKVRDRKTIAKPERQRNQPAGNTFFLGPNERALHAYPSFLSSANWMR